MYGQSRMYDIRVPANKPCVTIFHKHISKLKSTRYSSEESKCQYDLLALPVLQVNCILPFPTFFILTWPLEVATHVGLLGSFIYPACDQYCSMLTQQGRIMDRSLTDINRATTHKTHALLLPPLIPYPISNSNSSIKHPKLISPNHVAREWILNPLGFYYWLCIKA
jgi:hypothetical protein